MSRKILTALSSIGFSHPWMPMVFYLSLGSLLTSLSIHLHPRPGWQNVFFIFLGILAWTLIEYGLHRFIFHFQTIKEPWKRLIAAAHLEHHRTALTGEGILVRPFFTLLTAMVTYFLFVLICRSFTLALLLETGVFLGYIAYEWIHFAAHRFQPHAGLGKFLKHYHLHHHFNDSGRAFGVTTPFWDWVFGTMPKGEM